MCVPACAHISTLDTLQTAPLSMSANRSMRTEGSEGQWTIPVWSGTETSIQFLFIDHSQPSPRSGPTHGPFIRVIHIRSREISSRPLRVRAKISGGSEAYY